MRGKLRDKRSSNNHDGFRREEGNGRRLHKRTSRMLDWAHALEEEDYADDEYLDEIEEDDVFFSRQQAQK